MPEIFLNNGKSFFCAEDDTIILAAQKNNIFLDHSCLSGRCSSCKIKVHRGETIAIQNEITLSDKEKKNNIILGCVRKPLTDVYLDVEDLGEYGLKTFKTVPAKIGSIEKLTDTIIKVSLRLPPTQKINFMEGQYVDLIRGNLKRSYSIANSADSSEMEFFIKNHPGGAMSNYWFNNAKENDLLRLEGPKGTFFLRNHTGKENLVLLATGTGIAPLKSIVESQFFEMRTASFKNIYLLWGMQYQKNIFWKSVSSRIQFITALSREESKKYYVQKALVDLEIPVDKTVYYACGSDAMIQEVKNNLIQDGLNEQFFFSDSFLPSN